MRRNEQTRLQVGLTFPGSGPVVAPAAMPPVAGSLVRHWFDARGVLTRAQRWSRRHGLEGSNVACSLSLLVCGILFGLFVGGYVGFMHAATPPADSPYGLAQPATSDVGWTAMIKKHRSASQCPSESPAESEQETRWQRLADGAAVRRGTRNVPLDTPGFRSVKKTVVAR